MSLRKREKYIAAMNRFGVYPVLVLLGEYEQAENFEECQIIYEAITEKEYWLKDINKNIESDLDLPKHPSEMSLPKFKPLLDSLTGSIMMKNTEEYIKEIKKLTAEECRAK